MLKDFSRMKNKKQIYDEIMGRKQNQKLQHKT